MQVLQVALEMAEELDVLDLVLRCVDAEKIREVNDLNYVSDVILAQVQILKMNIWTQVSA